MTNELAIRHFEKDVVKVNDEFYEKYEQYLALKDWFETVKFQFGKFAGETGVSKWTNDRFTLSYIVSKPSKGLDTERMKKESILVPNGQTGELEEVNAYEYFATKYTKRNPYVKAKENE